MHSNEFVRALSDFIDRREYDQAENALFAMVRTAFAAGWMAAKAALPSRRRSSPSSTGRASQRMGSKPA